MRVARHQTHVLAAVLAVGAAACGELDNVTTVHDLRVLGVKCDPAGFLVDRDNPGNMLPDSAWQAQITALVVDPLAPNQMLEVSAAGCPDYIDAITSATLQGSKLCPPPDATSQIPAPIGPALTTTTIVPADMPKAFGSCDPTRAQSAHSGGMNVAMGDGSIRFISASVSINSWVAACDPRDGVPIGNDF